MMLRAESSHLKIVILNKIRKYLNIDLKRVLNPKRFATGV